MPDPLIWQAGLEYGLQALRYLRDRGCNFVCYITDRGPFLEAVALAVHQLELKGCVCYTKKIHRHTKTPQTIVLPRVYPLGKEPIMKALESGSTVITSDPEIENNHQNLFLFPRRDWKTLAILLEQISDGFYPSDR
jgi:hypothetical protein